MRNHYLAQYLINQGMLEADEIKTLLPLAAQLKPSLGITALCEGLCDADKLPTLLELSDDEFVAVASTTGLLSEGKIEKVKAVVPTESAKFIAAMLREHVASPDDIIAVWQRFLKLEECPVSTAVKKLAGEELLLEADGYAAYTEIFIHTLVRFMDTPAVVTDVASALIDSEKPKHLVSQRICGMGGIVAGIWADDDVFLELARRYSHEEIAEVDELALDSLTEFLNVLNGLYIVNLATAEMESELEAPRVAANVEPFGSQQLILHVETGLGAFALVLAMDEFIV